MPIGDKIWDTRLAEVDMVYLVIFLTFLTRFVVSSSIMVWDVPKPSMLISVPFITV